MNAEHVSETPDGWVVLKMTSDGNVWYKVFASWIGGYTNGDCWKINSGITIVKKDSDFYYFFGSSGSCYKCHINGYKRLTNYTTDILNNFLKNSYKVGVTIEVLPKETDWSNLIKLST